MVDNLEFYSGNVPEITPDLQSLQTPEGELHLRFYLPSEEEFALSAAAVREVMQQSPIALPPFPNASPLLLGTMNLRGQVIWVADLGQFLGDRSLLKTDRAEIPVIAIEDQETILGLAIERMGEMEWLDFEQLQPPSNVSDHIAPYVQGQWTLKNQSQQFLKLLDHVAILRSARWAA